MSISSPTFVLLASPAIAGSTARWKVSFAECVLFFNLWDSPTYFDTGITVIPDTTKQS